MLDALSIGIAKKVAKEAKSEIKLLATEVPAKPDSELLT